LGDCARGGLGGLLPPCYRAGVGPCYYAIGNGLTSSVAELTEAAAIAVGAPGAVSGSEAEARARLGHYFAEVLLLDQGTPATRARVELGWEPSHPGLVEEFRTGSYGSSATSTLNPDSAVMVVIDIGHGLLNPMRTRE